MHPLDVIRTALAEIRANKLRIFFTLLGIIVSVAFLVAVVAIIQGMNAYVKENVASALIGTNAFQVRRTPLRLGLFDDEASSDSARRPGSRAPTPRRSRAALPDAAAVSALSPAGPTPQADVQLARRATWATSPSSASPRRIRTCRTIAFARGRPLTDLDVSSDAPWSSSAPRSPTSCSRTSIRWAKKSDLGERFTVIGVIASKGRVLGQSFDAFVLMPLSRFEMIYGRPHTTTRSR